MPYMSEQKLISFFFFNNFPKLVINPRISCNASLFFNKKAMHSIYTKKILVFLIARHIFYFTELLINLN